MRRSLINLGIVSVLLCANVSFAIPAVPLYTDEEREVSFNKAHRIVSMIESEIGAWKAEVADENNTNRAWFDAAKAGNVDKIKSFIDRKIDINCRNASGETALILAAGEGHLRAVEMLLMLTKEQALDFMLMRGTGASDDDVRRVLWRGKDFVNIKDKSEFTAVDKAAKNGHLSVVRLLLDYGADPNMALNVAAENGHLDIVKLSLDYGADPSIEQKSSGRGGDLNIAGLLRDHGEDPNEVLGRAFHNGRLDVGFLLGPHGANDRWNRWMFSVDIRGAEHAIGCLLLCGSPRDDDDMWYLNIWRLLLEHVDDPKYRGCDNWWESYDTALGFAASNGHLDIVKLLLERGAAIHEKVLTSAAENGHIGVVQFLLDKGESVKSEWSTYMGKGRFFLGSIDRRFKLFWELFGEKFSAKGNERALICAARGGHTHIVKLLLDFGADPNLAADEYGNTALVYAAKNGHLNVVKLLLERGVVARPGWIRSAEKFSAGFVPVAPSQEAIGNERALPYAAKNGHLSVVKLLLDYGADPNLPLDEHGYTALVYATDNGNTDMVRLLLENGVKVNSGWFTNVSGLKKWPLTAKENDIALVMAARGESAAPGRFVDIMNLLLENGANPYRTDSEWSALDYVREVIEKKKDRSEDSNYVRTMREILQKMEMYS